MWLITFVTPILKLIELESWYLGELILDRQASIETAEMLIFVVPILD